MIKILIIVYIISFYLSLPGFFSKAGYNSLSGLIPIYNLYILFQIYFNSLPNSTVKSSLVSTT